MKTAIQELFSQLAIEHPGLFNVNTLAGREFINNYYKFFELEKQQIIDAYESGIEEGKDRYSSEEYNLEYYETAEQYYNETFKLNNHE
jgi:hypothetical protein